jgi:putative FmdB family regulatory protein
MPIYEYQCEKCGRKFEYMQSFSEPAKTTCESCGGVLEKLISAAAFHLKGTGWYKTDYASSGSSGAARSKTAESKDAKPDSAKKEEGAAASGGSSSEPSKAKPDQS